MQWTVRVLQTSSPNLDGSSGKEVMVVVALAVVIRLVVVAVVVLVAVVVKLKQLGCH